MGPLKISLQCGHCGIRELDIHAPFVVRVGLALHKIAVRQNADPAERRGRRNACGDTQARDRHLLTFEASRPQVEEHVPRRIGEEVFADVLIPKPPRGQETPDGGSGYPILARAIVSPFVGCDEYSKALQLAANRVQLMSYGFHERLESQPTGGTLAG